jgi:polyvinyl alcohol dehydrogenase (cytochrome)
MDVAHKGRGSTVRVFALGMLLLFAGKAAPGWAVGPLSSGAALNGEKLYKQHCAQCHTSSKPTRAPQLSALKLMGPQDIVDALEIGTMKFVGFKRTAEERRAIAEFITGKKFADEVQDKELQAGRCEQTDSEFDPTKGPQWNGWSAGPFNSRFQPAEQAGLTPEQVSRLKVKWAFGFPPNTIISQPTVVGGRIFVGTLRGRVYALDAKKGCLYWSIQIPAGVRTAMTVNALPGSTPPRYVVYFGDMSGNAHAVDAKTGEHVWLTRVDDYPIARVTGAPALHANRLYVPVASVEEAAGADPKYECCKFRGSVVALDAATGKKLWQAYTIPQKPKKIRKNQLGVQQWGPSGASVWSSPTVDAEHGVLYVTTGDNYSDPASKTSDAIVALDLKTGKLLWAYQGLPGDAWNIACDAGDAANCPKAKGPDLDFGSSAILRRLPDGKRVLLAGQKSGVLHAVDPDSKGKLLWRQRVGKGGLIGGIQWGPAADEEKIYVALSDIGVKIKQDPEAGTISELDGSVGGGIFAYKIATGEKVWATPPAGCNGRPKCSPAQSAAITVIPGVVFSGSVDGHLRAYATADGKVLWDFDTIQDFPTVNAVEGKGGSLDGPGPTVVGGMVYVNSGYGFWGGMPGNVLLAFSVDGK